MEEHPYGEHFGSHHHQIVGHSPLHLAHLAPHSPHSSRHAAELSNATHPPQSPHRAASSTPPQAPCGLPRESLAVSSPLPRAPYSPLHGVPAGSTSAVPPWSHPPAQTVEDAITTPHSLHSRQPQAVDNSVVTPSSLHTCRTQVVQNIAAGSSSHDVPALNKDKNPQDFAYPADRKTNRNISRQINSGSDVNLHKQGLQKLNDSTTETKSQLRKSTRQRRPPTKFFDYDLLFCEEAEPSLLISDQTEPATYKEACKIADRDNWHAAMCEEMDALVRNQTWDLVPLLPDRKALRNKWVYRLKDEADGHKRF
ncbi:uncharacterized protein LOC131856109 [Cryptomeria japonica]|uniref:uncharacterized protein LOC131856109 n=1 Tax=Cryptomeria japonica TaxID=3369 RepID=UPI0027DA92D0|nr:uncharacterized protein LOC131856109 [Cryptomeria japonica]